jgi:hypothetical protein
MRGVISTVATDVESLAAKARADALGDQDLVIVVTCAAPHTRQEGRAAGG